MSRRTIPIKDLNQVQAVDPDDTLALQPKDGSPAVQVKASLLGGDYCGPEVTVDNEIMRADGVAGCLQGSQSWVDDEGIVTATSYVSEAEKPLYKLRQTAPSSENQRTAAFRYDPGGVTYEAAKISLVGYSTLLEIDTYTDAITIVPLSGSATNPTLDSIIFGNNGGSGLESYEFKGDNGSFTVDGHFNATNGATVGEGLTVQASNINVNTGNIFVNSGQLTVDENGNFQSNVIVDEGMTVGRWFRMGADNGAPAPAYNAADPAFSNKPTLRVYKSQTEMAQQGSPISIEYIASFPDDVNDISGGLCDILINASESNTVTLIEADTLASGLRLAGQRDVTIREPTRFLFYLTGNGLNSVPGDAFEISRASWQSSAGLFKSARVTPAGSDLATAVEILAEENYLTGASSSTEGVRLPPLSNAGTAFPNNGNGVEILLINQSGFAINVYPTASQQIDGSGTGVVDPVALAAGEIRRYVNFGGADGLSVGDWHTTERTLVPPSAVAPSVLPPAAEGITLSGTDAQGADVIAALANQATTVPATSSMTLPSTALSGQKITIRNAGANVIEVYPPAGGTIDTFAVNAKDTTPIAVNSTREYIAFGSSLTWYSV